jgi:hypothetical protein
MLSFSKLVALGLLSQAGLQGVVAYPWMADEGLQSESAKTDLSFIVASAHAPSGSPVPKREEKRLLGGLLKPVTETVGNTLGGLAGPGGLLEGLLGSLGAATVRSEDKRPDAAHPFQVGLIAHRSRWAALMDRWRR